LTLGGRGNNVVALDTSQTAYALARNLRGRDIVVRLRRGLRALLAAALLASVGAASVVDGAAADFVGGDDGDAFAVRRQEEPALCASSTPRPSDVCAAPRRAPFVAPLSSPRLAPRMVASIVDPSAGFRPGGFVASAPLPSRAPPAV